MPCKCSHYINGGYTFSRQTLYFVDIKKKMQVTSLQNKFSKNTFCYWALWHFKLLECRFGFIISPSIRTNKQKILQLYAFSMYVVKPCYLTISHFHEKDEVKRDINLTRYFTIKFFKIASWTNELLGLEGIVVISPAFTSTQQKLKLR